MIFDVVTNTIFKKVLEGAVKVGNAKKLNGLIPEEFVNNENMAINTNWLDPVNSGGKTSWDACGETIDGWLLAASGRSTAELTDNGLLINHLLTTAGTALYQKLPYDLKSLEGKTITMSASVDGVVYSKTLTLPDNLSSGTHDSANMPIGSGSASMDLLKSSGIDELRFRVVMSAVESITIEWVKLELGKVATPYVPPNKILEYIKCKNLTINEFVNNENLLINPYFLDPVNSSGKTEWVNTSGTNNVKLIDDWKLEYLDSYRSATLTEDGLTLTNTGSNYNSLIKILGSSFTNVGEKYTLSIKANGVVGSVTFTKGKFIEGGTKLLVVDGVKVFDLYYISGEKLYIRAPSSIESVTIEWIKLEHGSIATPFIPPNKEVEKLKCGATVGDAETVNGFHVYGDLTDIGCTTVSTLTEVYSAMSYPSMIMLNSSQMTDASWNFPVTNLTVTIVKLSNIRGYLDAQHKNKNYTYRMGITDENPALPDGTWDKIGYDGEVNADTLDGNHKSDFMLRKGARANYLGFTTENGLEITIDGSVYKIPYGIGKTELAKKTDLASYLPLDGSVAMSGDLKTQNGWNKFGGDSAHTFVIAYNAQNDVNNYRALRILNSTFLTDTEDALEFYELIDGVGTARKVLHTGNSAKVEVSETPLTAAGSVRVW